MWGATIVFFQQLSAILNFNSHTPCGVRRSCSLLPAFLPNFNSHTPCGVRLLSFCILSLYIYFNSHTPCGVRHINIQHLARKVLFQLTHPMWGATEHLKPLFEFVVISTHTPHVGCDVLPPISQILTGISTHTPHVGCDNNS